MRVPFIIFLSLTFPLKTSCSKNGALYVRQGINHDLTQDYLKANNLKICVLLHCNRSPEYIQVLNQLHSSSNNVWYSFWDANNPIDYEALLIRLSYHVGVVVDLQCPKIVDILREISKRIFFHYERYWLMFSSNLIHAVNMLETQNINVDAEISIASPVEQNAKTYQLFDVYNPSFMRGGKLNVTQFGNWSAEDGLTSEKYQTKLERRRDFQGITFTGVVTIPTLASNETFLGHLSSLRFPYLNSMSRQMYRLFQIMQEMHNFKMFLRRAQTLGFVDSNGHWDGAIGMLNRNEIDICISGLRWENEHYGAFEATTSAYANRIKFIFRHPKSADDANIFTSPFDNLVWGCIFIVCIVCAYTLRHIFAAENHRKLTGQQSINEDSWSNSLLLVFGILFQQGYSGNPTLISSRIVTLTVLVFSLFVFQFYSSFIVGSLLTETPKTITTMKKLLDSNLEFGADNEPYILDNFEHCPEESTMKLYGRIMKTKDQSVMTTTKGLHLIKKGAFAFNTDGSYSYLLLKQILTDDEICDLQDIAYAREIPTGPAVPNKSPLKELIKISIRRMAEHGILAYHMKTWLGTKPDCQKSVIEVVPVDLVHFSLALYVVAYGNVLSFAILIVEIILYRFEQFKSEKNLKIFASHLLSFGKIKG